MFKLIVPARCTVEVNGAIQIAVNCVDGEVELLIELAVPVKPPVPASYWQDTAIPNPLDIEDEDGLPF